MKVEVIPHANGFTVQVVKGKKVLKSFEAKKVVSYPYRGDDSSSLDQAWYAAMQYIHNVPRKAKLKGWVN